MTLSTSNSDDLDAARVPDDASETPASERLEASPPSSQPDPYEGAVPPGYDWPTHGGYLGCLLGLMVSCLVGGFAGKLVGLYTFEHHITGVANVLLIGATILVTVIALGRAGYVLGRRFYREYATKPTWGESDAYRPEWERPPAPAHDDTTVPATDATPDQPPTP